MIIYIDENLAPVLARGFNILQKPENFRQELNDHIEVRSLKDDFEGAKDEEWIPRVQKANACVITQDYNIQRIRSQRALCMENGLGMFYFRPPSKNGFSYWDMLTMLVKHWPEIVKTASRNKRPFSFKVNSKSGKLEKMDE